jgi:type IV fimbrial biogenesis protein FimT
MCGTSGSPLPGQRLAGYSLIEMLISIVIVAVLIATGAPAFSSWLSNKQIRTATEGMLNGMQLARAEAVRRNTTVYFSLTSSVTSSCALSTSGANWVVSMATPVSHCGDTTETAPAQIIQLRSASETNKAVITSDRSQIFFDGLGRANLALSLCVGLATDSGSCLGTGSEHRLRVMVTTKGQIRMCNPALDSTDPQGC